MTDEKNILNGRFQDGSKDVVDLWAIPAAGDTPQKTGLSMPHLAGLRVNSAGTQIAFMGNEQPARSEVWAMENFLPAVKK